MMSVEQMIGNEHKLYVEGDDEALGMPTPAKPEGSPVPQPEPNPVPDPYGNA